VSPLAGGRARQRLSTPPSSGFTGGAEEHPREGYLNRRQAGRISYRPRL
jgi:hypothetical protein